MQKPESVLRKEIENNRTPSVQYAFFNKDGIVYEYGTGYADLKDGVKMNAGISFHAYSVTKTFTALSVLQLAEKKLLELDSPVLNFLPEAPVGNKVTIEHLLTHTSGLPNPLPVKWIHLEEEHASFDRNAFFKTVFTKIHPREAEPNTYYKYSNLGYVILGQLIEVLSKTSFEDYIREHIIDRLELQSGFLGFDILPGRLHATGYQDIRSLTMLLMMFLLDTKKYMGKPAGRWKPFRPIYVNGVPHGGMTGNIKGFVRYGQELLKNNCSLISGDFKRLLFTENITNNGKATGMCLSWHKGEINGTRYFTHAGGGGGYYCELRLYPEKNSGSFIIFNRSGFSDERFLNKVDISFL